MNAWDAVQVEVVGIAFSNSASLDVSSNGRLARILVSNCTFSDSIGNRAFTLASNGQVRMMNSLVIGNRLSGGGMITGSFRFATCILILIFVWA